MAFDWWWRWRERSDARHRPRPFPATMSWLLANPVARLGVRYVLPRLDLAEGMRVMDVGCGPGRLTIPLAERAGPAGEVVAFDLQREMLDIVERRARERGLTNVRTVQGGIGEGTMDFQDEFDRAVLSSVIGEVPPEKREPGMREIYEALKPGGLLVVSEELFDPDYRSPDSIRRLGTSAGFDVAGLHRRPDGFDMRLRKP